MGRFAAHRTAQLDGCSAAKSQERTLLRLVRYARKTRFGRDHEFEGIRTVSDYQRRVPLRSYETFWSDYWRAPFPYLDNISWPDRVPYFALSSGTSSGATKYIPLTRQMLASNQKAALTTLSLFLAAHPGMPLFNGRHFFLGGSTDLRDLSATEGKPLPYGRGSVNGPILAGDLSGITVREASPLLRPFTFPPEKLALVNDWDEKMRLLVEAAVSLPITMISGVPSWLLVLFDRLKQHTGREHIADIWPKLRLVIHGGTKFDPYRSLFRRIIGDPAVHFLETYPASEGFIATEDPRHGLLRLIPDHNLFFELVPVEDLNAVKPARHTVADLETGVQYAIVLTTCAGLWSYVLGDTVCFERRNPPLLRFSGRTRYFLSAFGEHLISEEAEAAITAAANASDTVIVDYHVGPLFPAAPGRPGRHRWFVEFAEPIRPDDLTCFARELDAALERLNEDYRAHRAGNLAMLEPEVCPVPRGGFVQWMRSRGRLGGQNKVPRMDNSGQITEQLARFFAPV
ncbi:MAG TPA: GH3 auxin-responsive promoter family protein [Gemmataceae bacterium]|nr:GH3 auxin-responsive promoter family protein [Gemmataceae bacterium]